MNPDKKEVKKKTRGGGFPIVNLEEAVNMLKKAAVAGWEMSKETFAKMIGGQSVNSGSFILKLAALRDYGLLERGNSIKYTQLAKNLVAPTLTMNNDFKGLLSETFKNVETFNGLLSRLLDSSTPEFDTESIGNIGVHEFDIALKRKKIFAENFVTSGIFAGILSDLGNGKFKVNDINVKNSSVDSPEETILDTKLQEEMGTQMAMKENYTGQGWKLLIQTQKPLNIEVRKKIIELIELLDQ